MATLVCFHAHPDDETIATGGTMALAAEAGHRVVLVVATRGEHGEVVPGVLDDGEALGLRRVQETHEAAGILGVHRVEFLGYVDSGMMGEPENDAPMSFWSADIDHAANRLAAILSEEDADLVTVYDDNGGYGHPDHIQIHRVGVRAAQTAGIGRVFQSTINRDHIRRGIEEHLAELDTDEEWDGPDLDANPDFGVPEETITHAVDVSAFVGKKRAAMRAHASQIADDSFFMAMSDEVFGVAFGTEWYMELGAERAAGAPFVPTLW